MALLKRGRKRRGDAEDSINITALLDVLCVVLFFLLKSFSVSAQNITTAPGLQLPASSVKEIAEDSISVSVGLTDLLAANNLKLVRLNAGFFKPGDLAKDGMTILALRKYLEKENTKRRALYAGISGMTSLPPGKIIIQADKRINFDTLKRVLHTASFSGYSDYQFAVMSTD